MKLSEMRELLKERGIRLTKSLGQNFLHDANQLRRIVAAAELTKADKVLEIGPGLGPLTELLLESAGEVLAIEKDMRLVEVLRGRFAAGQPASGQAGPPALFLLPGDALEFLQREVRDWSDWKLVANLPYSVASPILVELAQGARSPRRIVATLQREVSRRLTAGPGDKDYGVLTLLVRLDFEPRGSFKIPAGCFFPKPDVDSACVILERRPTPFLAEDRRATFQKIVKRAFSQRRKMMFKLLKEDWPEETLERAFAALQLSAGIRAEAVMLEEFVRLTELLAGSVPESTTPSAEIFDVVDEQDEVIGQKPRSEVHRLGLRHRAVHVLVFNPRGRIFLQKRSMKKDKSPGLWDSSASGHLASGEDYDACAIRELAEEIGLQPAEAPRRLFKLNACPETGDEFVWVYRCAGKAPLTLNPEEIERGGWFSPDHITRWVREQPQEFASAFRVIWDRWMEAWKSGSLEK